MFQFHHMTTHNFTFLCAQSPITIQVQIPSVNDKSEWKLNGQTIAVSLSLSDTVTNLKAKIQDETGMPPAKQKISYEVNNFNCEIMTMLLSV